MKYLFGIYFILYLIIICTIPVVHGVWPSLISGAEKLASWSKQIISDDSWEVALEAANRYKDEIIDWIPEFCYTHVNIPDYSNLHNEIFGQPLALKVTPGIFTDHIADRSPKKALLFYFHGWSGSGKNYLSTLLLNRIYPNFRKNRRSAFVKTFTSTWYDHNGKKDTEWKRLERKIKETINNMLSACPSSAFIFDEIDNFPPNFLDFLTEYIDHPDNGWVIQHNKAIFILLGNSHGTEINTLFYYKTVKNGMTRENLDYHEFEEEVTAAIRVSQSGPLRDSKLLQKGRIRAIVPFLPLSRKEVRQCVILSFKEAGYDKPKINPGEETIEKIVNRQQYAFEDHYALEGCHNIDQAVGKEIYILKSESRIDL